MEAFRQTVRRFDGSVAIAANAAGAPDRLQLALRGSGQALYVGLDDDVYVVASEPYGVVEDATRYLRLDGETPAETAQEQTEAEVAADADEPAAEGDEAAAEGDTAEA